MPSFQYVFYGSQTIFFQLLNGQQEKFRRRVSNSPFGQWNCRIFIFGGTLLRDDLMEPAAPFTLFRHVLNCSSPCGNESVLKQILLGMSQGVLFLSRPILPVLFLWESLLEMACLDSWLMRQLPSAFDHISSQQTPRSGGPTFFIAVAPSWGCGLDCVLYCSKQNLYETSRSALT
jgi:hypothetical protein